MNFFTSDTHFGHDKIIEYCNRPFADVDDMRRQLVSRWNQRVRPEDTVYHLGDFAMYMRKSAVAELLAELNGTKVLIKGNHDHKDTYKAVGWTIVHTSHPEMIGPFACVLIHDPNLVDNFWSDFSGVVLHGHLHGMKGRPDRPMPEVEGRKYFDVGVDVEAADYAPWSEIELLHTLRRG